MNPLIHYSEGPSGMPGKITLPGSSSGPSFLQPQPDIFQTPATGLTAVAQQRGRPLQSFVFRCAWAQASVTHVVTRELCQGTQAAGVEGVLTQSGNGAGLHLECDIYVESGRRGKY